MPRSGATYSLPEAAFSANTLAESSKVNSNFSDIATELTASVSRDGSGSMSGNLNMGSNRITALAAGTARLNAANVAQLQDNGPAYAGSTGGTATAVTATLTPAITAYTSGLTLTAKIATAFGVSPTLNVNSVGAKKIYVLTAGGVAQATTGDGFVGDLMTFRYDSALDGGSGGWLIVSAPATGWRTIAITTASSAAQVDFTLPAAYRAFKIRMIQITSDAVRAMHIRFSTDAGSTFVTGSNYTYAGSNATSASSSVGGDPGVNLGLGKVAGYVSGGGTAALNCEIDIDPGSASRAANYRSAYFGVDASDAYSGSYGGWCTAGAATDAVRLFTGSSGSAAGSFSGVVELLGLR